MIARPEDGARCARILTERSAEFLAAYGFGIPDARSDHHAGHAGRWSIQPRKGGLGQGYVSETVIDPDYAVLHKGQDLWMSTALLERESHAWHLHRCRGHVVIAGLGMGLIALAAARKPDVTRVTVFEIDADVIALFRQTAHRDGREGGKICLLHHDAIGAAEILRLSGNGSVDYAFADIWREYPHADAPDWTRRWLIALAAREGGFWGQEAEIARRCGRDRTPVDLTTVTAHLTDLGIPTIPTDGYAAYVRDVAVAHGLTPDTDDTGRSL